MSPLLIGISSVVSLLFLASLALVMMRKARNARDGVGNVTQGWPDVELKDGKLT